MVVAAHAVPLEPLALNSDEVPNGALPNSASWTAFFPTPTLICPASLTSRPTGPIESPNGATPRSERIVSVESLILSSSVCLSLVVRYVFAYFFTSDRPYALLPNSMFKCGKSMVNPGRPTAASMAGFHATAS